MCGRGSWRGFHSRKIDGRLAVMEQCTQCGNYRARAVDHCPFVERDTSESTQPSGDASESTEFDIMEPEADDGGSIWGPDVGN